MTTETWVKDWIPIVAATIAAASSLATLVLSTSLTFRRERRKSLWERELQRFFELEETAGKLAEELLTYELRTAEDGDERFWQQYGWLKAAAGRFRRYPKVLDAIREFNHAAAAFYQVDKRTAAPGEYDERGAALNVAYEALLRTSDIATGRPKT